MTADNLHITILVCYSLLELWMGLNKLKANSIPELIWDVLALICKIILSRLRPRWPL